MKQILKCFMFFIIINILSGCSFKGLSEMMLEEENQDLPFFHWDNLIRFFICCIRNRGDCVSYYRSKKKLYFWMKNRKTDVLLNYLRIVNL